MTGIGFSISMDIKVLGDEGLVLKDEIVRSISERENRSVVELSDSVVLFTMISVCKHIGQVLGTYHVTAVGHCVKFQRKNSVIRHQHLNLSQSLKDQLEVHDRRTIGQIEQTSDQKLIRIDVSSKPVLISVSSLDT